MNITPVETSQGLAIHTRAVAMRLLQYEMHPKKGQVVQELATIGSEVLAAFKMCGKTKFKLWKKGMDASIRRTPLHCSSASDSVSNNNQPLHNANEALVAFGTASIGIWFYPRFPDDLPAANWNMNVALQSREEIFFVHNASIIVSSGNTFSPNYPQDFSYMHTQYCFPLFLSLSCT